MKIQAFICIDEHGNFQILGSSRVKQNDIGKVIELVEDGIKNDTCNSVTTSITLDVTLPSPKEQENVSESSDDTQEKRSTD